MKVLVYGNLLCFHMEGSAASNTQDSDDEADLKKFCNIPGRTEKYDGVVKEYKDTVANDSCVEGYQNSVVTDSDVSTDLKGYINRTASEA